MLSKISSWCRVNGVIEAAWAQAGGRAWDKLPGEQRDGLEHLQCFSPFEVAQMPLQSGVLQSHAGTGQWREGLLDEQQNDAQKGTG